MDREQDRRFRKAVERKMQESEAASKATRRTPGGDDAAIQGDQEGLLSPAQTQDTVSPRDKSTRHKKVTADKWNQ